MSNRTCVRATLPERPLPTLLHIDSSPMLETSVTRRLTTYFVARWQDRVPGGVVIRRDLAVSPPPHPDALTLESAALPEAARSPDQQAAAALSDVLLEELEAADVVLIGAPMYNFSVPSTLKVWFDLVSRPGRTFRYGPEGHEGLLAGKTIVAVTGRGGFYAAPAAPEAALDLQEALFRNFFEFMGLTDVRLVHAEGQGIDSATAARHEAQAREAIDHMLSSGLGGTGPAVATS